MRLSLIVQTKLFSIENNTQFDKETKRRNEKMNVQVIELSHEQAILNVETKTEIKALVINKTEHGHSYDDFAGWEITDEQYYDLEKLVDRVIEKMENGSSLNVEW